MTIHTQKLSTNINTKTNLKQNWNYVNNLIKAENYLLNF